MFELGNEFAVEKTDDAFGKKASEKCFLIRTFFPHILRSFLCTKREAFVDCVMDCVILIEEHRRWMNVFDVKAQDNTMTIKSSKILNKNLKNFRSIKLEEALNEKKDQGY